MKMLIAFLSLGFLSACSTIKEKDSLQNKIQAEEVRSLKEIKFHATFLLESHPELDADAKKDLKVFLDMTMAKQHALKDEESRIFQLLLKKSLSVNQQSDKDIEDKDALQKRLKAVYDEKSKNVVLLINKIVSMSEQKVINDSFEHDMMNFMRDLR